MKYCPDRTIWSHCVAASLIRRPGFPALLPAFMLYAIAHDANPATWTYYVIEKFGWTAREVGWSLGGVGISVMIVQGGLVGPIVARFGEEKTAILGFAVLALGFTGYAFAPNGWTMYLLMLPFALGSVAMPALRTLMSGAVARHSSPVIALTSATSPAGTNR